MKKFFIFILGVTLFACTQQKGFRIDVELEGAEGQVLLEQREAGGWIAVDTAEIVNGVAVLEGEVSMPGAYYLSVMGQRAKTVVFVENTRMVISGKADSIYFAEVSGSATHNQYKTVDRKIRDIGKEYMALYQEARTASAQGDSIKAGQLMKKVDELYKSTNFLQEDFVKEHPASYATPFFLERIQYGKEVDELDSLVNALDPKLNEIPSIVDLKKKIEKLKKVAVGQMAPDFTQNDVNGEPVKFSYIYSKHELTLLDFWASWCGPCRSENPNVVAVFNDYKDKGFTVLGVSLDKSKEAWIKGIEDDGLAWTHVSDLAYWNNYAAKLYAVSGIPHSILVDKNGRILAKNKRGDKLREAVAAYLENNR